MKKLFYFLLLFSVKVSFAGDVVNGNKFHFLPMAIIKKTATIEEIAERLLNDQKFTDVIATFTNNSMAVRKVIVEGAGEEGYEKYKELAAEDNSEEFKKFYEANKIDPSFVYDKVSENVYEWGQLLKGNTDFAELSSEDQQNILVRIQELFTDDFVNNHPGNPFVEWLQKLLQTKTGDLLIAFNQKGGPKYSSESSVKLSISEVGKCLLGAGVSFLASNYKALRTMVQLLDGEWSFSGIREVVCMFIPEAKIASTIIGFAGCIITAMIW
jgi:hypothetical protein